MRGGPRQRQVAIWRRVRSEISTFPCPHGPVAAATSDRMTIRPEILQRPASCAPRAHHFCHRLRLRPKQWSAPPTGRALLAAGVSESRHWCSYQPPPAGETFSRVSGISPGSPHGPPPRFGAAALNATDEEKNRELVMALVGQKPGDAPCRPHTPLLAPFITCSVLLRVNNILFRR